MENVSFDDFPMTFGRVVRWCTRGGSANSARGRDFLAWGRVCFAGVARRRNKACATSGLPSAAHFFGVGASVPYRTCAFRLSVHISAPGFSVPAFSGLVPGWRRRWISRTCFLDCAFTCSWCFCRSCLGFHQCASFIYCI